MTEKIADLGLERLRAGGHEVDVRVGIDADHLPEAVRGAHALIIRSATRVTADVIAAGVGLIVIGRAGIGLDNVDVDAATRHGVMVVNAPLSNAVSAAEHTIALMLAQARSIPQAHAALVAGRWERAHWVGVELHDKVLGILGLGRIGQLVAQRAAALGMHLLAHDPYVSEDRARQLGAELVDLDTLVSQSDFLTLHVAKTPETLGMLDADLLAKAKPTLRIVNVARGGVVDEAALADAIAYRRIAGAALDVFETEPTTASPLFALDGVVVTPHLGASTTEAQDKAGVTIAEQVLLALDGDWVPYAVNVAAPEAAEVVRPFLPLAEKLGVLFAGITGRLPEVIDVEFSGEIGGYDNELGLLSVVKGLVSAVHDEPVSFVNAVSIAKERGIEVRSVSTAVAKDYVNVITVRGGGHSVAGTLWGLGAEPRLVMLDDHSIDLSPMPHMIILTNDDRPGVIGRVGTTLGDAGVNINGMNVGRSSRAESALMVISTDEPVPDRVATALAATDGVTTVRVVSLAGIV